MSFDADPALTEQDVGFKLTNNELLEFILIELKKLVAYQEEALEFKITNRDIENDYQ